MGRVVAQSSFDEVAEAEQRVGRVLRGKWRLDALLDLGGMAAVYAATHRNGLRGAVKILHRHRSIVPDIAARFRREGYIANKVAHPNAVRVLDDDVDEDGSVFLVMELLEGVTLSEHATSFGGKLPADRVLLVIDPLLEVLAVAHDQGIVHRDIKPENVFLTSDGHVKVLDFGIAGLCEVNPDRRATAAGDLPMGSPAFMSPEQARGRWDLVDAQSDVWSVGATMFTLLSGQIIHEEQTLQELLAAVFTKPVRPVASVVPDLHPRLAEVIDRALHLRRSERWADARAMRAAVRAAYAAMTGNQLPAGALAELAASQPLVRMQTTTSPEALTRTALGFTSAPARPPRARKVFALVSASMALAAVASLWSGTHEARSEPSQPLVQAADAVPSPAPIPVRAPAPPTMARVVLEPAADDAPAPVQQPAAAAPSSSAPTSVAPVRVVAPAALRPAPGASATSTANRRSLFDRRF